jgi:hypothetical protein
MRPTSGWRAGERFGDYARDVQPITEPATRDAQPVADQADGQAAEDT